MSTTIKPAITALTRKEMLYCLPGFCQELFTMRRAVMRVSKMSIGLDQGRAGKRGNTALMRINLDFMNRAMTITWTHSRMIIILRHGENCNTSIVGELHLTTIVKKGECSPTY